jgi:hypothetical protein
MAISRITSNAISGIVSTDKGGTGASTLTAENVIIGNGTSAVKFVAAGASGNVLTSNGTAWLSQAISAGGDYVMTVFTSPATWTKPTGLKAVKVTVVGGGGGLGSAGPAPVHPRIGDSGGTSSFGAFLSATGGGGGTGPTPARLDYHVTNGAGGIGTGGDIDIPGLPGRQDYVTNFTSGGAILFGTTSTNAVRTASGDPSSGFQFFNWGGVSALGGERGYARNFNVGPGNAMPPGATARPGGIGGGASTSTSPAFPGANRSGGGGGTSIKYITAPDIPGPVAVTVGAGGGNAPAAPPADNKVDAVAGIVIVEEFY